MHTRCLRKVATYALDLTGFFYCQVTLNSKSQELLNLPEDENVGHQCFHNHVTENSDGEIFYNNVFSHDSRDTSRKFRINPPKYQTGVLRTNCSDCLDRTNVAQFAYGWAALGHQLHALGYINVPIIDLNSPLADDLMLVYENMGDTLALQYGGSAAHKKIFSQRRGQWKAATQSQVFFISLQRYYSNAYRDAQKQDAINVFLGYYQPQVSRPALLELESDQHSNGGSRVSISFDENTRVPFQRSMSDGNIVFDGSSEIDIGQSNEDSGHSYPEGEDNRKDLSESSPEISTCESDSPYPRFPLIT